MRLYIECSIIGLISAICCLISYQIIYYNKINRSSRTKIIDLRLYRKFLNRKVYPANPQWSYSRRNDFNFILLSLNFGSLVKNKFFDINVQFFWFLF